MIATKIDGSKSRLARGGFRFMEPLAATSPFTVTYIPVARAAFPLAKRGIICSNASCAQSSDRRLF